MEFGDCNREHGACLQRLQRPPSMRVFHSIEERTLLHCREHHHHRPGLDCRQSEQRHYARGRCATGDPNLLARQRRLSCRSTSNSTRCKTTVRVSHRSCRLSCRIQVHKVQPALRDRRARVRPTGCNWSSRSYWRDRSTRPTGSSGNQRNERDQWPGLHLPQRLCFGNCLQCF